MKKFDNQDIITSREANALNGFGGFTRFSIKPLNITEAFNLIKKYDNNGETSKLLIEELNTNNNLKLLNEFLGNTLMVSLLYMTYSRVENIPKEKIEFYNQVYNTLYEEHDLTKKGIQKAKKSQISKMDFKRILNALGFLSVQANKASFLEDELFNLVKKAIGLNCDIKVEATDIMSDIIESVPFFIKKDTHLQWIHKSFSEYFAANFIAFGIKEDKKKKILETIINYEGNEIYINVLDFYFDLDKKGARQFIIYKIVSEYIEFYNKSYQHDIFKNYLLEFLDVRRSFDFLKRSSLQKISNVSRYRGYLLVAQMYSRRNIIEILYNKGINIFKSKSRYMLNHKNELSNLIETFNHGKDISIRIAGKAFKDLKDLNYIVNDEANNILNNSKYFKNLSRYMFCLAEGYELLDYYKCLELKNTIEQEIEDENKLIPLIQ